MLLSKIKRGLRDLYYYAKRNPVKVFMLVVMPLITGGALQRVLAQLGVRLPPGMARVFGGGAAAGGAGRGGYSEYERYSARGSGMGMGGSNWGDNVSGLMSIAKMFM